MASRPHSITTGTGAPCRYLFGAASAAATAGMLAVAASAGAVSISVSPSNLIIPAGQVGTLTLTNPGSEASTYDLAAGNYALTANGRVQIDPRQTPGRSAKDWITITPGSVTVPAQGSTTIRVATRRVAVATPGDHQALVLITSRADTGGGGVGVRTRVGIGVVVRVPGRYVRRLSVNKPVVVRRGGSRVVQVRITNRGNINERFNKGQVRVTLRNGARRSVVIARAQNILPGTYGIFSMPYTGPLTGPVQATAVVRPGSPAVVGVGITSTPRPITTRADVTL